MLDEQDRLENIMLMAGSPLQRKWPQKKRQGKHREFGNFAKTQLWNLLILKIKDITSICHAISQFFL